MTHIVIITAKGGNQSLPDKNVFPVAGKPLVAYPILAAQAAKTIDHVFVTTEDERISQVSKDYGATVLERPATLAQPLTNHGDVILYSAEQADSILNDEITTVTILLGNSAMIDGQTIDRAVECVVSQDNVDSAMTVWTAQDDHPFRAMVKDDEGYLVSFLDDNHPDTNRQSYPTVLFYDQGPRTMDRKI